MRIAPEVMVELDLLQIDGCRAVITRPLDRKMYTRLDEVLKALGGKWNRGQKAHVFPSDAGPLLDVAITTGEVTTAKDLGFFPTPVILARELVEMAGVTAGQRVLEPSAGTGRIVSALLDVGALVTAVERDASRRAELERIEGFVVLDLDDCMSVADAEFDAVVMNPPFCKVGLGDHLDHIRHCFEMLRPGGTLVSVGPASIEFRQDKRHTAFRAWVDDLGGEIESLPEESFKASGTGVRTCVVKVRRS